MTEAQQLHDIRHAIFAIVNALGATLPHTPEVLEALDRLVRADMDYTGGVDRRTPPLRDRVDAILDRLTTQVAQCPSSGHRASIEQHVAALRTELQEIAWPE